MERQAAREQRKKGSGAVHWSGAGGHVREKKRQGGSVKTKVWKRTGASLRRPRKKGFKKGGGAEAPRFRKKAERKSIDWGKTKKNGLGDLGPGMADQRSKKEDRNAKSPSQGSKGWVRWDEETP